MLRRQPPNEYHQMLPYYIGGYEPKQIIIAFESAREISTKKHDKILVKRRFERIYNMMDVNSYTKNEENPENEEIYICGFKHVKLG